MSAKVYFIESENQLIKIGSTKSPTFGRSRSSNPAGIRAGFFMTTRVHPYRA
jgi:hypothetical protein